MEIIIQWLEIWCTLAPKLLGLEHFSTAEDYYTGELLSIFHSIIKIYYIDE